MPTAVVCGAGGFIGGHLVTRLKTEGYTVIGIDQKLPEFSRSDADTFEVIDLREHDARKIFSRHVSEVYQLAADMGGAGYIFTGDNDAAVMQNSASINLNVLEACREFDIPKVFYSSSACIYPERNQMDPDNPVCTEDSAYPADPDSEYGWEKLFSERLYFAYARNHGIDVKVARFHNIFGELGTWQGGREKAPAALCRKVAEAEDGGAIEIWGDGKQTRSFLYIEECIEGVRRLMSSDWQGPVNIGSDETITINDLAHLIADIAGKSLELNHLDGPLGVRGRTSDNRLIQEKLGWSPKLTLRHGMQRTYEWVDGQVKAATDQ